MIDKNLYNFTSRKSNILMNIKYLQFIRTLLAAVLIVPVPFLIAGNKTHSTHIAISDYSTHKNSIYADELFEAMQLEKAGLSKDAFIKGWKGYNNLTAKHVNLKAGIITIVDFSKPSSQERLFVVDLDHQKILFKSLVAHGKNSGTVYAKSFSNQPETYKSSLGFYKTLNTYDGDNGFSLRLEGLEKNINDNAYERAIVMHGADYVSKKLVRTRGYIGRSYGCPAIPHEVAPKIIKLIKGGSLLFLYHPNEKYQLESGLI